MPLARITTPLPEYYERLAQDLRARGFDVETANPGQFLSTAADLEITVKECGPEGVAKLIAAASAIKDMCVVVTPGARDGGIRSIEMIVLQPKEVAVRTAGFKTTPAQVIEIASALVDANVAPVVQNQVTNEENGENWPKVKVAAESTWAEVVKTTLHWMASATAALHTAGKMISKSALPLKDFFLEVGEETRKFGRSLAIAILPKSRRAKQAAEDDEQLVPSMFDLSFDEGLEREPADPIEDQEVVSAGRDPQADSPVDRRFLKAAGVAAAAVVAILLTMPVMRRPSRNPVPVSQGAVETKGALPASVSLKPSALVTRGAQKNLAPYSAPVLTAKQVVDGDSEAEDTIVRHADRSHGPKRVDTRPQIKRYSDLD